MQIHEPLFTHAKNSPDNIAIIDGEDEISYATCEQLSGAIASLLSEAGVQAGDRVGIWLNNSAEAVIAILSVLRIQAIYVPLNPEFPDERLNKIIEHSGMHAVIGNTSASRFEEMSRKSIAYIQLESNKGTLVANPDPAHEHSEANDIEANLCYIMYTSGTTGDPKGVMISHDNVQVFLDWAVDNFSLKPEDRFSGHPRISFDLSVFDIFASLRVGGTYIPLTQAGDLMFPGNFIQKHNISIWFSVPSVLGMMMKMQQIQTMSFESLRHFLVCGEALNPEYAKAWLEHQNAIPLWNLYGPTEATIACSYCKVKAEHLQEGKNMPIGIPMTGSSFLVTDAEFKTVLDKEDIGSLMICGKQLSKGYWRRDDLSRSMFIKHIEQPTEKMYISGDLACYDEKGLLVYQGRQDQQIQWMGYRVELTEIESAIAAHKGVQEVSVIHLEADPPRLIGALAVSPDFEQEALFQTLKKSLPDYMIPRELKIFEVLPKNDNGKIDRKAIKLQCQKD